MFYFYSPKSIILYQIGGRTAAAAENIKAIMDYNGCSMRKAEVIAIKNVIASVDRWGATIEDVNNKNWTHSGEKRSTVRNMLIENDWDIDEVVEHYNMYYELD